MTKVRLSRREVLACRAAGHGLANRGPAGAVTEAAGLVGLRRTKTVALAVAARVDGVVGDEVGRALKREALVAVFGARGTVMVVPPDDIATFTVGAAPADDESLRAALPGAFLRHLLRNTRRAGHPDRRPARRSAGGGSSGSAGGSPGGRHGARRPGRGRSGGRMTGPGGRSLGCPLAGREAGR